MSGTVYVLIDATLNQEGCAQKARDPGSIYTAYLSYQTQGYCRIVKRDPPGDSQTKDMDLQVIQRGITGENSILKEITYSDQTDCNAYHNLVDKLEKKT